MDTDTLRRDVRAFREALEACHGDLDATIFGSFPRGCCGAAVELLAAFLERRGHSRFAYVCGLGVDVDGRHSSHAWLERDGLIVDVTRDQFGKDGEPVLVTTDSSWHDTEFPEQEEPRGFGELPPGLCEAYARIQEDLESTPGESTPGA